MLTADFGNWNPQLAQDYKAKYPNITTTELIQLMQGGAPPDSGGLSLNIIGEAQPNSPGWSVLTEPPANWNFSGSGQGAGFVDNFIKSLNPFNTVPDTNGTGLDPWGNNPITKTLSDLLGGIGGDITGGFGMNDLLWNALAAWGGYQVVFKKRTNLMNMAMLFGGLYMAGHLTKLLPRDSSGNVDIIKTALPAISMPMATMMAYGAVPLLISAVLKSRRKKRSYRRYSRPRYYSRRRSYRR